MKVMLQARGLWDAIERGDVNLQEDRMGLEAILRMISTQTAKLAWEALKTMYIGNDRVRKAKAQSLRFDGITFKEKQ